MTITIIPEDEERESFNSDPSMNPKFLELLSELETRFSDYIKTVTKTATKTNSTKAAMHWAINIVIEVRRMLTVQNLGHVATGVMTDDPLLAHHLIPAITLYQSSDEEVENSGKSNFIIYQRNLKGLCPGFIDNPSHFLLRWTPPGLFSVVKLKNGLHALVMPTCKELLSIGKDIETKSWKKAT